MVTTAFYTTQHNTTLHNTTQHSTTQHNTTQHNTTQHNTTQHTLPANAPTKYVMARSDRGICATLGALVMRWKNALTKDSASVSDGLLSWVVSLDSRSSLMSWPTMPLRRLCKLVLSKKR
jgi:hypothetical protein